MSRNEITLQRDVLLSHRGTPEGGRWGTAHIYQSAVNAFSVFTKWQPMPMRKLSPTVLKRFENFLRQRNCSWNTVSTYIKAIRSVYNRAVDRKMVRYVPRLFEHVYTGTRTDRKKALEASDIGCLVRETEMSLQDGQSPNTRQKTKIFFVLMFMLRGIPLWTWPICIRGIYKETPCLIDAGRRTGTDRVIDAGSYANGENDSEQGQGLSLFIPHITK